MLVVVDGDAVVARWRVDDPARPDLAMVDTLARFHLAARRLGLKTQLQEPSVELCGLLELVGLAQLRRQLGREPECHEQLGVEEVVEAGDAPPRDLDHL